MNKVYLFLGIESQNWEMHQFDDVITYCKSHNIDGILLKVYEVTQGEWYMPLGGMQVVTNYIELAGIECIPYGFFYGGSSWLLESNAIIRMMELYTTICLNLESDWDNNNNGSVEQLTSLLKSTRGCDIWISTWANPADHFWMQNIQMLDPYVVAWLPECYNDELIDLMLKQFPHVNADLYPTYEVGNETISKVLVTTENSLWEYQSALQNTQWVDSYVSHQKEKVMPVVQLVKNSFGMLFDMPFEFQLENLESPNLCGNYGVALFRYAGLPNKGARGSGEDVDVLADKIATQWNDGPVNEQGSSIPDMYNYLTVLDSKGNRAMHFQEINPTYDRIVIALNAGYGLLVTANEQNIRSTKTGQRPPYPWSLNANHIIPIVGLHGTDYIVPDYLNNKFQGEWPCIYDASVLQPSWAVIIQLVGDDPTKPWLAPIPSGDPLNWPKGFNAQLFNTQSSGNTLPPLQKQANDVWNAGVTGPTPHSMIFQAWLKLYPTLQLGQPTGKEVTTVDLAGNAIQYQGFGAGYHFEWSHADGKSRLYDVTNKLVQTL